MDVFIGSKDVVVVIVHPDAKEILAELAKVIPDLKLQPKKEEPSIQEMETMV